MSCSFKNIHKVVSNGVVGGKTARACDNCVKKRARWYCAADDAFLCQACDLSVHSANSLARRHERVRLKTASSSSLIKPLPTEESDLAAPTWHRGFTRKARTPRNGKNHVTRPKLQKNQSRDHHQQFDPLVPEICSDETSHEENEDQLLYRVPIFDPFVAELCTANSANSNGLIESKAVSPSVNDCGGAHEVENTNMQQFLPTEMDLAEFAADVESLLGRGLENECFGIEGLGFGDCEEKEMGRSVKVKEEEEQDEGKYLKGCSWVETSSTDIDMMRPEPLELNFEDYEEEDQKVALVEADKAVAEAEAKNDEDEEKKGKKKKKKKKILLRLDYEAVITAWASQGSPWTAGDRPDFDPDACWPDCMGTYNATQLHHHQYMDLSGVELNPAILADGGREARVSRYREKRRTRLFSKKIRYEVRKLNAEKRPRMKGRFVKRASFAGPTFPAMLTK